MRKRGAGKDSTPGDSKDSQRASTDERPQMSEQTPREHRKVSDPKETRSRSGRNKGRGAGSDHLVSTETLSDLTVSPGPKQARPSAPAVAKDSSRAQVRKSKGRKGATRPVDSLHPPGGPLLRSTPCEKTPETGPAAPVAASEVEGPTRPGDGPEVAARGQIAPQATKGKRGATEAVAKIDREYVLKGEMGAIPATGTRGGPEEEDDEAPDTKRDEPGGDVAPITATGGTPAAQQAAVDALMEESGISTVDQRDAEEWRLIRDAKIGALHNLKNQMDAEDKKHAKDKLTAPELANVGAKLGQMEKDKMGVIQLKVGKPSDRVRGGMRFRAKIGVQSGGAEGAPAQAVVEVEATSADEEEK